MPYKSVKLPWRKKPMTVRSMWAKASVLYAYIEQDGETKTLVSSDNGKHWKATT